MAIPPYKKVDTSGMVPLHSFDEYASACNVIKLLEIRLVCGEISDKDRYEYLELFKRVEHFEETNKIRQS